MQAGDIVRLSRTSDHPDRYRERRTRFRIRRIDGNVVEVEAWPRGNLPYFRSFYLTDVVPAG